MQLSIIFLGVAIICQYQKKWSMCKNPGSSRPESSGPGQLGQVNWTCVT